MKRPENPAAIRVVRLYPEGYPLCAETDANVPLSEILIVVDWIEPVWYLWGIHSEKFFAVHVADLFAHNTFTRLKGDATYEVWHEAYSRFLTTHDQT